VAGKWTHKNLVKGVLYLERVQREKVEIVQVRASPKIKRVCKKTAFAKMVQQNNRGV
jgi:hypothetical protein